MPRRELTVSPKKSMLCTFYLFDDFMNYFNKRAQCCMDQKSGTSEGRIKVKFQNEIEFISRRYVDRIGNEEN